MKTGLLSLLLVLFLATVCVAQGINGGNAGVSSVPVPGSSLPTGIAIQPGSLTAPASSAGTIAQYNINGEVNVASPAYVANPRTSVVTSTTAITDGVTANATLGAANGFVNGEGIALYNADTLPSLGSSVTPTVTQTGYTGANGGATQTYSYQIAACDASYRCKAASAASVNVNGPVVLSGPNTANGTGANNTGGNFNTLTGYTVAGAAHYIIWRNTAGAGFLIWAVTDFTTFADYSNHQTMGINGPYGNTPPVTDTGGVFVTTILSGAGTTSVVLNAIPPRAGTWTAWPDATTAFTNAAAALTNGGVVRIPVGYYKVRTFANQPSNVYWIGAVGPTSSAKGTLLQGTPGYDIWQWSGTASASDNGYINIATSGGRNVFASTSTQTVIHQVMQNVTGGSFDYAGTYCNKCPKEEWYFWNTTWLNGWFGYDFEGDGTGNNYINKVHLDNTQFSGAAVNAIRIFKPGAATGGVTFTRTINTCSKQDGMYIDASISASGLIFDGYTEEGTGSDFVSSQSTATCTSGSNVVAVTSATGLAVGQNYIVLGCGANSDVLEGTICNIAGLNVTLQDPTCTSAVNAGTTQTTAQFSTNAIYDNIYGTNPGGSFNQVRLSNANLPQAGAGGGCGGSQTRFQVLARNAWIIDNATAARIEDTTGTSTIYSNGSGTLSLSRPLPTGVNFAPGQFALPTTQAPSSITTLTSSFGGDIQFGLVDSVGNGTGTTGNYNFYNNLTGRQKVFRIEGVTGHQVVQGTKPTITLNNCGTIAAGNVTAGVDTLGHQTTGTTTTSCVIHFAGTWAVAPDCTCWDTTTPANVAWGSCTANFTDLTIPMTSNTGDNVHWHCMSN